MTSAPAIFIRTLKSLGTPGIAGAVIASVILSVLALWAWVAIAVYVISSTEIFTLGWLETGADVAGYTIAIVLAWFLFPVITPLLSGLLAEKVAGAIDQWEYNVSPASPDSFIKGLSKDLWFILKALGLNIICLPLYLIPLVNIAVYYALNSHLLGREFFIMVAARHVGRDAAELLRRQWRWQVQLAGAGLVLAANIPLCNLFLPFLATAVMTHLFHSVRGQAIRN